jgi:hypothetical protein
VATLTPEPPGHYAERLRPGGFYALQPAPEGFSMATRRYAEDTKVPVERSRSEIESVLQRYGATAFCYGYNTLTGASQIEFVANSRRVRFILPIPADEKPAKFEQVKRQRWRALLLSIKAKLEAVECGISEFESEFLANIVDPSNNRTVGESVRPLLADGYNGRPQALRLGFESSPAGA